INADLTGSLAFSSGGFQPKYGDKMSSVLDIEYKHPIKFAGIASVSLLGANLGLEGASQNHRFRFLFGARYKTNQYLLNSLDVSGNYRPTFTDIQTDLQYDLSPKLTLEAIGHYSG